MKDLKDMASPSIKPFLSNITPWLSSKKMAYQSALLTTANICS